MSYADMIIQGLWGTDIAKSFTVLIGVVFVVSFLLYIFKGEKRVWISGKVPAILTSIGLFGTFVGIAIGLGEFDSTNIDASVINLLDGMKLAFWTSILGMLGALIINCLHWIVGLFTKDMSGDEVEAADILKGINENGFQLSEMNRSIAEGGLHIKELVDSIGSGKDSSLLSQIKNLRTETNDAKKALVDAFNDFAAKVAENNSKALIEALKDVIKDFNEKITAQFGENFKQLNEAVGRLLDWQKTYRSDLEKMIAEFNTVTQGIETSKKNVNDIVTDLRSVPETMTLLKDAVIKVNNRIVLEKKLLEDFTALRTQAENVFPTIQKAMTDLTNELKANVEEIALNLSSNIETTASKMDTSVVDVTQKLAANIETTAQKMDAHVETATRQFTSNLEKSTNEMTTKIDNAIQQMKTGIADITQRLGFNIATLTQDLSDEIKKGQESIEQSTSMLKSSTTEQNRVIQKMGSSISETVFNLQDGIKNGMSELQATFTQAAENIKDATEKHFNTFDSEMENALTEAIKQLGTKLASVAAELINEYDTLVSKLNALTKKLDDIVSHPGLNRR